MAHKDDELSDVVVVLNEEPEIAPKDAAAKLAEQGLTVSDIDADNGIVEGTIETSKVQALKKLPFVKYVRDVFNYVAESGEDEDTDPEEPDDAAA
jgi:hypothetical protein